MESEKKVLVVRKKFPLIQNTPKSADFSLIINFKINTAYNPMGETNWVKENVLD